MKKIICALLIIMFAVSLFGCNGEIKIKEYKGTPLAQITYVSFHNTDSCKTIYVFDFNKNTLDKNLDAGGTGIISLEKTRFYDKQKEVLINKLYSYGLFDLKEYDSIEEINESGGWLFDIRYADGTHKRSMGKTAPEKFSNIAKAFYDVFEDGIVAEVPENYYLPPNLSYKIEYTDGNDKISHSFPNLPVRGRFKWNGFEENYSDIYLLNYGYVLPYEFKANTRYKFFLNTSNYGDNKRFKRCEVNSYDCNENLTSEKKVVEKGWFRQVEFDLELNRIYVIKLIFDNGDYVDYTFNTKEYIPQ